jgi:hypothetical protein
VPVILIDINASSDRQLTAGTELSFPIEVQKEELMGHGERNQILKDSLRVLMGRFGDQDSGRG